jgi:hypothetical protein
VHYELLFNVKGDGREVVMDGVRGPVDDEQLRPYGSSIFIHVRLSNFYIKSSVPQVRLHRFVLSGRSRSMSESWECVPIPWAQAVEVSRQE